MDPNDRIEELLKALRHQPGPDAHDRILGKAYEAMDQGAKLRLDTVRPDMWRIIMTSKLAKLAAAAVVVLTSLFLWRVMEGTSNAFTLLDVPRLMGRAKMIHVRTRHSSGGLELRSEYWSDLENGRLYRYSESLGSEPSPEGLRAVKSVRETVSDGQFVMTVDHRKKTVEFERLLASQEPPRRLIGYDMALKGPLQDIENFEDYTQTGHERIDGQRYDIWRREFKDVTSHRRVRCEYWVSPTTGAIGRVKLWSQFDRNRDWELVTEMDKIETDVEPPADIFATEPPAGYTLENRKAAAEMVGPDVRTFRGVFGHTLRVPASYVLEDGSVLACWRGLHDSVGAGPDRLYEGLVFGGDLPRVPVELLALMSLQDENNPGGIHFVGRHVATTRKAGRVYEWALYVPQQQITAKGLSSQSVAFIRLNAPQNLDPAYKPSWSVISFSVTEQSFAEYVWPAIEELSDSQAVPAQMAYDNLLVLANEIRTRSDPYEASRRAVAEVQESIHVATLEPVKPEEIVTPEQVSQQARQLVEAFYAAIVEGRDADAIKMLMYQEPRASRAVAGMKQLPGVRNIEVEDICATEETALVITSEFAAYEGRRGRWAIGVLKEKGTWLIKDFDATTTETMQEEIDTYLDQFPKAEYFPAP